MNSGKRLRPPCVLVVDDDHDGCTVVAEVLELEGYSVVTAADGRAALAQLESRRVDAIVLDLLMPVMNGWELLEVLGARPELAAIPVVVVSASHEFRVEGTRVRAFLRKPLRVAQLLAVLAACLAREPSPPAAELTE